MSRVYCVKCHKLGLIACVCVETSRVIVWRDWQMERARKLPRSSPEIAKSTEYNSGPTGPCEEPRAQRCRSGRTGRSRNALGAHNRPY